MRFSLFAILYIDTRYKMWMVKGYWTLYTYLLYTKVSKRTHVYIKKCVRTFLSSFMLWRLTMVTHCDCNQELEEAPNKNYFNLLFFIPMWLNALWELIRSFILPLIKGSEYKESCPMIMARVFGLIFPGSVAHAPQDYVNVTRLGSIPSHMPLPKAYLQKINLKSIQVTSI